MKCPYCPNYEQKTSYGTETVKCNNKECERRRKSMELKDTIEGMTSEDYKERFKAEYQQLSIRLNKLNNTIAKAKTNSLEFKLSCPLQVLEVQAWYMKCYAETLRNRAKYEGVDLDQEK